MLIWFLIYLSDSYLNTVDEFRLYFTKFNIYHSFVGTGNANMKTKTSIIYGLVGNECLDTNLFNYMKKE